MKYQVIKAYNNNVVLAKQNNRQVILVSKGIGFGKKSGDDINESANIEQVFHEISANQDAVDFEALNETNQQVVEITKQILEIAEEKLGKLNDNIEKALKEHIEFAIERLKIGLNIENPFIDEIISLYQKEYEVAQIAGKLIEEKIGMTIGEEEEGFIALHLYSARTNKTIHETMNSTRFYKGCISFIEDEFDRKIYLRTTISKSFLTQLKILIRVANTEKNITMSAKHHVNKTLKKSYKAACKIAAYLEQEKGITLSEDMIAFLAVDIEKLIQMT